MSVMLTVINDFMLESSIRLYAPEALVLNAKLISSQSRCRGCSLLDTDLIKVENIICKMMFPCTSFCFNRSTNEINQLIKLKFIYPTNPVTITTVSCMICCTKSIFLSF